MPLLTIITSVKPFVDPHIINLQRNAFQSWKELGPDVDIVVVGEEAGLAEVCQEMNLRRAPAIRRNQGGTPLVSSIYELGRQASTSPLLAYINADILVMPDFLEGARQAAEKYQKFLIMGRRWDLDVTAPIDFSEGWQARLWQQVQSTGKHHRRVGSDYFIFPRDCFVDIPDLTVGRAFWDNWMIYWARRNHWATIDGSDGIQIIHQNHDYSHLPHGQSHHKHPDTYENVRLGGGSRTTFLLDDANKKLTPGGIVPMPLTWKKFWREVEIFPLVTLHSYSLAQAAYAFFHPIKAYKDVRAWRRTQKAGAG
ncbi:MAG TPA: glycosyltransferase family A protein [Anaerolineaceae bacterium]|nr:glycosyltransferase family A protein [Anaerolineaceae bacterium]